MDSATTEVARIQRFEGPSRQVGSMRHLDRMQHLPSFPTSELTRLNHHSPLYYLEIAQSPDDGRVNVGKSKGKPLACSLHPEPIIRLKGGGADPNLYHQSNPHFFCIVELVANDEVSSPIDGGLGGVLVSSLHKLKAEKNQECGYFIFGDLCPKYLGIYRLKFVLFELRYDGDLGQYAKLLTSTTSGSFPIREAKGMGISKASTELTRSVAECGVKIRIRKEPTNKRKQSQTSWGSVQRPERASGPLAFSQPQGVNPAETGPGMPPNRRGESIMHRLTYSRNHTSHLDNQEFEDSRQRISGQAGIAPWGVQAAPVDNHQGFQASQALFSFGRPDLHGMNTHMNNNHMSSMVSGSSNTSHGMMSGFNSHTNSSSSPPNEPMSNMMSPSNAHMKNALSPGNCHSNHMVSGLDSHMGIMMSGHGGNAGNFAPLSQLSSLSSGSGLYDDMPTTSMPYTNSMPYTITMPYNATHSNSMPPLYSQQHTNSVSHAPSVPPLYNQQYSNTASSQGMHTLPLPNPGPIWHQNSCHGSSGMVFNN
ncbi:uncharacterized protein A1O9_05469 [Exophiala aquamarina CBS 119918]|uniref:Velvet domain-containing protein n=1 Tax=Exophiala aquamarina CBS 119918 TaxID=1182545 RepID=A0A072PCG2_9EURO|nr:uncharacterized protein A1O9_05469 [Exophiala aquamarina CBS 119918]KEF57551.1 hypothetical protein A1O9_05469 [Exophiala aquamarina CBS 119918]